MNFSVGDRVCVTGPPGSVEGEILHVATPAELVELDLPDIPRIEEVRYILAEFTVDLLMLVEHKYSDIDVAFWALHYSGGWRDLHGQDLTVEKL